MTAKGKKLRNSQGKFIENDPLDDGPSGGGPVALPPKPRELARWNFGWYVKRGYWHVRAEGPTRGKQRFRLSRKTPVARLMAATLFADRHPLLPHCRAYLAIGMFAGLRPDEIDRLDWRQVDLDAACIRVLAANAKDRERRIVDIQPNLAAWLRPLVRRQGRVLPRPLAELRTAARTVLRLKEWPHDIMRHTFVSYHFAQWRSEAETKHQVGHRDDGRIFYNHYMKPRTRADARRFWSIIPPYGLLPAPTYDDGMAPLHGVGDSSPAPIPA